MPVTRLQAKKKEPPAASSDNDDDDVISVCSSVAESRSGRKKPQPKSKDSSKAKITNKERLQAALSNDGKIEWVKIGPMRRISTLVVAVAAFVVLLAVFSFVFSGST